MLIRWIMDTLRAKNARLEDANSRLRSLNAQLISAGNEKNIKRGDCYVDKLDGNGYVYQFSFDNTSAGWRQVYNG